MEIMIFCVALLAAIVLSNTLDRAFTSFPLSLVQIGLGVVIALTPINITIELEPEMFLGILIAPILFREAEEADLTSLWRVRKEVVFMVFALVLATVFAIGFSLNFLIPAIPLAACCCLGGILGPTDPIAVNSMANRVHIDNKIMSILKGEFLINDASGVISFNFAALALVTGAFSVGRATLTFIIACVGGLVVGLVVCAIKNQIMQSMKRAHVHNASVFMIMELLVPFICFFVAEAIGGSGIIAAVTAGVRQALVFKRIDIFEANFAVIKKSIWEMISIVFNSFIFILLGLELPIVVRSMYHDADSATFGLAIGAGLLMTGVMYGIRYIGISVAVREMPGENMREVVRNRVLLTFSGVKGTVSLATAFALPAVVAGGFPFAQREELLFIAACAIIFSLVIATILLPYTAKAREPRAKNQGYIAMFKESIERLEREGGEYTETAINRLRRRMIELTVEDYGEHDMRMYRKMRNEFYKLERRLLEKKLNSGKYTEEDFMAYARVLMLLCMILNIRAPLRYGSRIRSSTPSIDENRIEEIILETTDQTSAVMHRKYGANYEHLLDLIIEERAGTLGAIIVRVFGEDPLLRYNAKYRREHQNSFEIEREVLREHVKAARLTEEEADEIRLDINALETFTIGEKNIENAAQMFLLSESFRRRRRKRH